MVRPAAALRTEIFSQADWCAQRGNQWNLRDAAHEGIELSAARRDQLPIPQVYDATAGRITEFRAKDASRVIAFCGAVDAIRLRIESWAGQSDAYALRGSELRDLAQKWRAACFNALLALRALEPIAEIPPEAHDEKEMQKLKRDLEGAFFLDRCYPRRYPRGIFGQKKCREHKVPGESNREASRLGDVGSHRPSFQALRLKQEVKQYTRDQNTYFRAA